MVLFCFFTPSAQSRNLNLYLSCILKRDREPHSETHRPLCIFTVRCSPVTLGWGRVRTLYSPAWLLFKAAPDGFVSPSSLARMPFLSDPSSSLGQNASAVWPSLTSLRAGGDTKKLPRGSLKKSSFTFISCPKASFSFIPLKMLTYSCVFCACVSQCFELLFILFLLFRFYCCISNTILHSV